MSVKTDNKPEITFYVVPNCPLCTEARMWLSANGVSYSERDVANDFGALRAMYKLTKQSFVPVFELKGRALVRPTHDELRRFLV